MCDLVVMHEGGLPASSNSEATQEKIMALIWVEKPPVGEVIHLPSETLAFIGADSAALWHRPAVSVMRAALILGSLHLCG
jgi:hypothetical protein